MFQTTLPNINDNCVIELLELKILLFLKLYGWRNNKSIIILFL